MTGNYSISEILKAGHVKRWHIVDTVKSQSLAEHQWNVALIAQELLLRVGANDSDVSTVVGISLTHDLHEVRDGDLPSPTKERLRANGWLSPESQTGIAIHIPGISGEAEDGAPVASGGIEIRVSAIVRLADLIETYNWISQYAIGRDAPNVIRDCRRRLNRFMFDLPEQLRVAAAQVCKELK